MNVDLIVWHLGALHPVERVLTLVLAFGPFLLLGIVIAVRRRQDGAEDLAEGGTEAATGTAGAAPEPVSRKPLDTP